MCLQSVVGVSRGMLQPQSRVSKVFPLQQIICVSLSFHNIEVKSGHPLLLGIFPDLRQWCLSIPHNVYVNVEI